MSKIKIEIPKIRTRCLVKGHLQDDLHPDHDSRIFNDAQMWLYVDPDDAVVKAHRLERIAIEHRVISKAFTDGGFCNQHPRTLNGGRTRVEVTVIVNEDTDKVRIVAKVIGTGQNSSLPTGMAIYETTVEEIWYYMGVKEKCWPLAEETYLTMRGALSTGNASVVGITHRALQDRLWQLDILSRVESDVLREMLGKLVTVTDVFIEAALQSATEEEAVEMATHFIEGGTSLSDELKEKVAKALAVKTAEEERKSRSVTTLAEMLEEKERQEQARKALHSKRSKRTVANLKPVVKPDAAPANSAETESSETEGQETDEDTVEGTPDAAPTTDETTRLTASQKRIFAQSEAKKLATDAPTTEASKPTETETKKVEPAVGRDLQAQLAKLKGLKPAGEATVDAASTAESAKTE